jgi:NADH-quinone oxidoreductase subunit G
MPRIFVDDRAYEIEAGRNLLHACLSLGMNLPYFCWHPALGSVGACRQCAVKQFKDEKDTRGRLVMACMTPAADSARISIRDEEAAAFRAAVVEGLMLSHPHDCPVCDEGGECHLQDMTVMTGHDYRRYSFGKRVFRNQYLGPFVAHEMNRCIQCYRCVRYYRDYAGGTDLNSFSLRNTVFFGRHEDGVLENEFSGNLVEICPTGVFTDKTLSRHYTRKWDLQFAPSVCVHCGAGCNTSPAERYGTVRRVVNRYNGEVNGYFLCDRGRFGYEFVNGPERLRQALVRTSGALQTASAPDALERFASILKEGTRVIGIGSARASLEANYALRTLVGPENFFSGVPDADRTLVRETIRIFRNGPFRTPSIREIEFSDAVFLLGEDPTATAPRIALALRQSVRQQPMQAVEKLKIPLWLDQPVREVMQNSRGPFFIAAPWETRLDDIATETFRAAPEDLARLGFAVAHALVPDAPGPSGLDEPVRLLAGRIAEALKSARRPVIVTGTSCRSIGLLHAAANVALALQRAGIPAGLAVAAPECNSVGIGMMDAGRLSGAFEAVRGGKPVTTVVLETDLYRIAERASVQQFLGSVRHLVVLDSIDTATAQAAEVVLPSGTFAESDGSLVSGEGRAQRYFQVLVPAQPVQESWRWIRDALVLLGRFEESPWDSLDDVISSMCAEFPELAPVLDAAPSAAFRLAGQKIGREPHRFSGRTAIFANLTVHEPAPPPDPDSPLAFTMEGYPDQPPPSLIPFFWTPGWNSIQSLNKFQSEVGGPLRGGDPGIRMFEPSGAGGGAYFEDIPENFRRREGQVLILQKPEFFGTEELSRLSPAIRERIPAQFVQLSQEDARRLALAEGEDVEVELSGVRCRLSARISGAMQPGTAGVPAGFGLFDGAALPAWGRMRRA